MKSLIIKEKLMGNNSFDNDKEIQQAISIMKKNSPDSTFVDFYEQMQLENVRSTLKIFGNNKKPIGYSYVDDYDNLYFDFDKDYTLIDDIAGKMIDWGVSCVKKRNKENNSNNNLDYSCKGDDIQKIEILKKSGFILQEFRTLYFSRSLDMQIKEYNIAEGFKIRSVKGKSEVNKLVKLHQSAFDTVNMTIEERLAIMNAPGYIKDLDLVVESSDGVLVSFCICGFKDNDKKVGYTDPIGTDEKYQKKGLAKALVTAGLMKLKNLGAKTVELGTTSENIPMQKLAISLGFKCFQERLWFSKVIIELI